MNKNTLCIICSNTAGKRVCKINNDSLICPVCCAKSRNPECEGCEYYALAVKFSKENKNALNKIKKIHDGDLIMRIDPEIDEKVDLALIEAEKGNLITAEIMIAQLLKSDPDIDMVQYGMGVICSMKKDFDKALIYFDNTLEINPYFVEAWYNKASTHRHKCEFEEMIKAYLKVVEYGDEKESYVSDTKIFMKEVEEKIRKVSNQSIDEYLKNAEVYQDAMDKMNNKDWISAAEGFLEVIKNNPKHVQSYGNLGLCFAFAGYIQKALELIDVALKLDPDYEPAKINRQSISKLNEGEKLSEDTFGGVNNYYKEKVKKKYST